MKNFGAKCLAVAAVFGAAAGMSFLDGCGGGDGGGGTTGTAGSSGGKGGTSAGTAGSTAGKGGATSTAGTGGSTSTGGKGGATSTAGTGGSGTAGTGGGSGGSGLPCPPLASFDTNDMQGFALNTFMGTTAGSSVNLAVREAGAKAVLSWDGGNGDPFAGALKVDAPFDDYNQFVDIQHGYGATALQNWSGNKKLHVRVKVTGGNPSSTNPMGIQPYINTGSSYSYCSKYSNLVSGGGWNDYIFDLSTCAAPVDTSMVIAYGVSVQAGNGLDSDGGLNSMKPAAATIWVDSFWLEGSCGTGGTGGGTGGTGGAGGAGGGTAGTGGGTGGTGLPCPPLAGFDTNDVQGFALNTFMGGAGSAINLAVREAGAKAMLAWDGTNGDPFPGSLKVDAPFDDYNQFVDIQH
ncbi:MAG TPA: hypothetical protein VIF57_25890, partial [Polyangia bacterium]